jgi:prepilin-type N-terminal cleavage/methylation domain-containing protein
MFAPPRANAGFSLLEALVALTIVGSASVAALATFGAELRADDRAGRALVAQALADDRMACLRLAPPGELDPLTDSLRTGRFAEPFAAYRWEAASHAVRGREGLYELNVAVRWDGGDYTETTRLYRPPAPSASR